MSTRDVREYLVHAPDCVAEPGRVEQWEADGLAVARCVDCAAHFPPTDPHAVSGGMVSDRDPAAAHAAHVAAAERRLANAGSK